MLKQERQWYGVNRVGVCQLVGESPKVGWAVYNQLITGKLVLSKGTGEYNVHCISCFVLSRILEYC